MNAVRKVVEKSSNPLFILLPKEYENKKLEVIVMTLDDSANDKLGHNYDFSDLLGKLKWKGDALAEQKN